MAKQSRQIRGEIQNEGRRVNSEHQQFMDMIMGRINDPSSSPGRSYLDSAGRGFSSILGRGPSAYGPMFMDAAKGGLVSDENRRRIRGNGVFDEFQRTGGFSEGDLSNIRSRSNRTIPAFYEALKNRFKTQAGITGAGPSYTSSLSRISRDQSRAAADTALDTELGIKDRVNEGRRWGTEGMSSSELGLANLESANKRFGIEGGARNELSNLGIDLDALRGILGVGEANSGEQFRLYDMLLGAMGQRGSLAGGNLNRRMTYDPNVSWFDRLMQIWNTGIRTAQYADPSGLT